MKNVDMNEAERLFIHTVMFREGIVPMEDPNMDVRRALADLPPDEARKLKRKFRKLWRKKMKSGVGKAITANAVKTHFGTKGKQPTRANKQWRKQAIWDHLKKTQVDPMVKQFKEISREEKQLTP